MEDLNHLLCNLSRPKSGSLKGDPRMNCAVELRLSKPQLPLLDTLRKAGFVFLVPSQSSGKADCPNEDNILDADGVSLRMRKNQLSDRVWRARERFSSCSNEVVSKENITIIHERLSEKLDFISSPTTTEQTVLRNGMSFRNIFKALPNQSTSHGGLNTKETAFPRITSSSFSYMDNTRIKKNDQLVTRTGKGIASNEQKGKKRNSRYDDADKSILEPKHSTDEKKSVKDCSEKESFKGKRMRTMHEDSQTKIMKEEKEHDYESKIQQALSYYQAEVGPLLKESMSGAGFDPDDTGINSLKYTHLLDHIAGSSFSRIEKMHTFCRRTALNENNSSTHK